jgi:hypothetical protein
MSLSLRKATASLSARRREAVALIVVALAAIAACVLQAAIYGLPVPTVHDEFSYLLAADTFARGRCTNPTPPLWEHFETPHVLLQPTYASKYPPGQGLFLAAGILLGHPIIGVWSSVGLACAAGAWMLRAFVPRGWALAGGLIVASRLGFGKWGWDYWGGSVAFAGGALFIGGWLRLLRKPRPASAALMAVGLVLLAISRPYEGLLLCVPVALATLIRFLRSSRPLRTQLPKSAPAALLVLLPAALALGYYNHRVTGNALRLPYAEYSAQYDPVPPLLFLEPKEPPTYRHKEMWEYQWNYQFYYYDIQRKHWSAWWEHCLIKVRSWRDFFLGYGLTLPLLVLPCVLFKSPRTRFTALAGGFVFGMVATTQLFGMEHYVAPAAPLLYAIVVQCFRYISLFRWRGRAVGRRLASVWLAGCLLAPIPSLFPQFRDLLPAPVPNSGGSARSGGMPAWLLTDLRNWLVHPQRVEWAVRRMRLEQQLRAKGGRHLVLVEYGPDHFLHDEWVYNGAAIEGAAVIWARPMGREGVDRLARQFVDRSIWFLYVTANGENLRLIRPASPS